MIVAACILHNICVFRRDIDDIYLNEYLREIGNGIIGNNEEDIAL